VPYNSEKIKEHTLKYNNTDVFTTALQSDNEDIRNANQQGALYFDFDGEKAQEDVIKLTTHFIQQECPEQSLQIYFSGNKGFHLEVPFEALDILPAKDLHKAFGVIAKDLKTRLELQSLDTGIYDQVRLWRLPNSINSKSGLYKIPLYIEELHIPLEGIKALAKTSRLDFEYQEPVVWKDFKILYEKAKTLQLQVYETKEPLQLKDAVGIEEGSRDNTMLKLACSLLRTNYSEQDVLDSLQQVNRTYNPPLDETAINRIFRQATNYAASEKSSATQNGIYKGSYEMSQETKLESTSMTSNNENALSQGMNKFGMPEPILLSDLSAETYNVEWIWEGFLARGHKTLLAALWKAGKSTLIRHVLKAIGEGKSFAGYTTTPCNVLILTEESKSQWVEGRDTLGLGSEIYILSNPLKYKLTYPDWIGSLEYLKNFCKEKEIGLVIIDTISEFWSVNDENKASEVTQALLPLNFLTEENIAVLLIHHFRKSGGTQGTAARGSGALSSKVDILIDFTRYEDNEQTTKRKLSCLSRFDETPKEIILDYIDSEYVVLGNSAEVRQNEKLSDMLRVFEEYPQGFTAKEVWENWDSSEYGKKLSKRTIQRHIADLMEANKVAKIEDKEVNGKIIPLYKVIYDKTSEGIDIQKNVAGTIDTKTIFLREQELLERLQKIDKNSEEYVEKHKEWFQLRIQGEKDGLFEHIIPALKGGEQ